MSRVNFTVFVLLLIMSYTALPCVAQIESLSCGGFPISKHCNAGRKIVLTGKNFAKISDEILLSSEPRIAITVTESSATQLSGKIEYNKSLVPDGPYAVSIPSNKSNNSMFTGTILFGDLFGFTLSNFYSGTPPDDQYVTNEPKNTKIFIGYPLNITGKFKAEHTYNVLFYSDQIAEDYKVPVVTCNDVKATNSVVSCTINGGSYLNRTFHFLVQDLTVKNFITMKNIMGNLTFEDPFPTKLPVASGANGTCVDDSAACVDGANITINGYDFFEYTPDGYHVNIENLKNAECTPLNSTTTSLTCTLHGVNKTKGMFTLTVQIRYVSGELKPTKRAVGTLVLGERKGTAGFTIDYINPNDNGGNTPSSGSSSGSSKTSTITTALTIVFAVLFAIALIVLIIVMLRFKLVNRST